MDRSHAASTEERGLGGVDGAAGGARFALGGSRERNTPVVVGGPVQERHRNSSVPTATDRPLRAVRADIVSLKSRSRQSDDTSRPIWQEVGMAQFVPTIPECVARDGWLNAGEIRVAEALASLDDDWTVYVQPRLGMDIPDFVALHDRYGVCAIEVKDWAFGKFRNVNGVVEYRRGGVWNSVKQHPRLQVHRYQSSIFESCFAQPDHGRLIPPSVRSMVVLLNHPTKNANEVLRRKRGAAGERAAVRGEEFFDAVESQLVGKAPVKPPADSMAKLRAHLDSATYVSRLLSPEPLSEGARNIAKNPNGATMRRVRGSAGCGKTYGLAARAAALAAEGQSVLVLSYNVTLTHYLRKLVARHSASYGSDPTKVTCIHFHGYCGRLVEEAKARGVAMTVADGTKGPDTVIRQAISASEQDVRLPYDAILVDEGQDFELDWWNLLRQQVRPGGEMLLVADPTQNIYGQAAWTDEDHMLGAGFSGPWTMLDACYRLPNDMVGAIATFGRDFVGGDIVGPTPRPIDGMLPFIDSPTVARWQNVRSSRELPEIAAKFAADLAGCPERLDPSDIVLLCETHEQGLLAVRQLEKLGHEVHHMFAKDKDERKLRKQRFWADAPGIKACTVHSFKGWESRAVVLCIGDRKDSARLAYVAMTRLQADAGGRSAYIGVVNANRELNDFRTSFRYGVPLPPPDDDTRVA